MSGRVELPEVGILPLAGERVLVVACDPSPDLDLSAAAALLVAADRPLERAEDAPRIPVRELTRLRGSATARRFRPTAVVVHSLNSLGPRLLASVLRLAPRRVLIVDAPGAFLEIEPARALALATVCGARRLLAGLPGARPLEEAVGFRLAPQVPSLEQSLAGAQTVLAHSLAREARPLPRSGPLRVVHYVGTLAAGGAERQLSYLAARSRALGHEVEVWAGHSLASSAGHYAPRLRAAGVRVELLPRARRGLLAAPWGRALPAELTRALLAHATAPELVPLVARLLERQPDVLHGWLDETCVVAGLAGLAAEVPRVVISTRNLTPLHFPRLLRPWMREAYRQLLRSPRVRALNNSRAGARDYQAWTGCGPEVWRVIHNGFDVARCAPLEPAARARGRAALGLSPADFLVVGVFRLDPEKRPLDFVEVLARARARLPALRALHLGEGPLRAESEAAARQAGLGDALRFLGVREDPWAVLGLADVLLLTSSGEGLPNVVLEAQALEVPVVVTDAGGAGEALDPGRTGLLAPIGALDELADHLVALAQDPGRRAAMGAAGRRFVAERFALEAMVERSLALYRDEGS